MPDLFHFRFYCVLVIEITAFPVVAMRYERKMRRLFVPCLVAIALGIVGLCLSLLRSFYLLPTVALAAGSLSLSAFSSSILAIACGVLYFLYEVLRRQGGLRHVLTNWDAWKDTCKIMFRSVLVFAVLWVPTYLFNFYKSYRVFVSHRPALVIAWTRQQSGFEMTPGVPQPDLTPEYLRDRQQYVVDIGYSKDYAVPIAAQILFQFPCPVDQWKENGLGTSPIGFGPNTTSLPFILRGPFQFTGQKQYRNWVLNVPQMNPGGTIRLLVTLNIHPQTFVMMQGPPNVKPPFDIPSRCPPSAPLYQFIRSSIGFSFGGQFSNTEGYAPFKVDSDGNISIGNFTDHPPNNLGIFIEMP